MSIKTFEFL